MNNRNEPRWTGPSDGPWSTVSIDGELERADREWLHTNGAGAYAMSTLALMHTRRHHGIFVAALDPPLGRHVLLSHFETNISVADKTYKLSTHRFPNVAPTPGYRSLKSFSQDPLPRWTFRLGKSLFERSIALCRGKNALVIRYHWMGRTPARLSLMPLMPLRPVEHLAREHGGMVQRVTLRPAEVEVQPLRAVPPITFGHRGVFMGSPDWWRRFEYSDDLRRYTDFQEDMWTPGTFELTLDSDSVAYVIVSVGPLPTDPPQKIMENTREYLLAQDPGTERSGYVRTLMVAADSFCNDGCGRPAIVAGYPWLGAPLRDWLIAMPGIMLSRDRLVEAKRSLQFAIELMRGGLLPATLTEGNQKRIPSSPDATLWLFECGREISERCGPDDELIKGPLFSALVRAFVRLRGRRFRRKVWLTDDGLLATVLNGDPATWMDARAAGKAVTPRSGLAIEHQALWFRAAGLIARLARHYGHTALAAEAGAAEAGLLASFGMRFWCNETRYPFDTIGIGPGAGADPSIRPNALIALALAPQLFEAWQADAILARARAELVTPLGLRTLAPNDAGFRGHYEGPLDERESALHQGTVWPFLLEFWVRALLGQRPEDRHELRIELERMVQAACEMGPVLGHVAQIADAEEPHRVRGCPAQAWSVASLLRSLVVELGSD